MNILFTGGSSFTGMWFVRELEKSGHNVTATLLRGRDDYTGIRGERVSILSKHAEIQENCKFGDPAFMKLIDTKDHWDILCHHAADVTDYKSSSFDYLQAVENNTHNLPVIIEKLKEKHCKKMILTGSVFEQGEGAGSEDLRAVSPYGLSKGLTADIFEYYCAILNIKLGKFVIPNPFGPYEEKRFTHFLMDQWCCGKVPNICHPDYVRDNIHVSLLAKAYVHFIESLNAEPGFEKINPSGYISNQGEFTLKFAKEMQNRLLIACKVNFLEQKDFTEPLERVNTDSINGRELDWCETKAWDSIAEYYSSMMKLTN